jgi:hypothetical protein
LTRRRRIAASSGDSRVERTAIVTGRYTNASLRWFGVIVLVMIATAPPCAQIASSSDLRVSVTVARSCTVSTAVPTPGLGPDSLVSVRCAEGATPAKPQVSVVEAAPRVEEEGTAAPSDAPDESGITLVIVNF